MDLSGWEYVVTNGVHLVGQVVEGRLVGGGVDLSPVFEAHVQLSYAVLEEGADPVPAGARTFLTPVFGYGLDKMPIPPGALRIPLLSLGNRQAWENMLRAQFEIRASQKRAVIAARA